MMRHLVSAQYWTSLAGGNTGRLLLTFRGPVCTDWISNCPLDRVLTYKNLIYLLNLQICVFTLYQVAACCIMFYYIHKLDVISGFKYLTNAQHHSF